jgi:hypothetical protein
MMHLLEKIAQRNVQVQRASEDFRHEGSGFRGNQMAASWKEGAKGKSEVGEVEGRPEFFGFFFAVVLGPIFEGQPIIV